MELTLTFFELAERIYGICEILKRQVDFSFFRKHLHSFTGHVVIGRVIGPIFNVVRHHFSVWGTRIEYFKKTLSASFHGVQENRQSNGVVCMLILLNNSQNTTTEVYTSRSDAVRIHFKTVSVVYNINTGIHPAVCRTQNES